MNIHPPPYVKEGICSGRASHRGEKEDASSSSRVKARIDNGSVLLLFTRFCLLFRTGAISPRKGWPFFNGSVATPPDRRVVKLFPVHYVCLHIVSRAGYCCNLYPPSLSATSAHAELFMKSNRSFSRFFSRGDPSISGGAFLRSLDHCGAWYRELV